MITRLFSFRRKPLADLKQHEEYMLAAIEAARQAKIDGGAAIGAVLVNPADNTIVARGESLVGVAKDPTAHAEINAIRELSQRIGSDDLYGYVLYSTLEPCHMCLSAAAWARICEVYFGAYRSDVDQNLFETVNGRDDEDEASRMNLREKARMQVQGGILGKDCAGLLAGYHDGPHHGR